MLRRLGEEEAGSTLVELLVAAAVGTVVLFAVFGLVDSSIRMQATTADRVEATARGRLAMEAVTRALRTQACLGTREPLVGASARQLTFHAVQPTAGPGGAPLRELRRVELRADGTLVQTTWRGGGTPPDATYPSYPARPEGDEQRVLARGLAPVAGTPVFRPVGLVNRSGQPQQVEDLGDPVPAADLWRAVRIDVAFDARPERPLVTGEVGTEFSDSVFVGLVEPTKRDDGSTALGVRCT